MAVLLLSCSSTVQNYRVVWDESFGIERVSKDTGTGSLVLTVKIIQVSWHLSGGRSGGRLTSRTRSSGRSRTPSSAL